jgi:curved DNA-binding protein CbpA
MAQMSYYDILGIDKNAGKNEIKKSYKKLALKYHPDMNHDIENTSSIFIIINTAYEALLNEEKKKEYDKFINRLSQNNSINVPKQAKYHPVISKTIDEFNYVLWDFEEMLKKIEKKYSISVEKISLYDFIINLLKYLENEILNENYRYNNFSTKKERIMLHLNNYYYLLRVEIDKYIQKIDLKNNNEIKRVLEIKDTLIKKINEFDKYLQE